MLPNKSINLRDRNIAIFFALAILFSMLINVSHPYLWGPDEPRVAEIARETFISGNYITPHLCAMPFIEKPPLYFNMVVCAYGIAGDVTPGAGRLVSALLGCMMLGIVFGVGYLWRGSRAGVLAVVLLITMPQFYRMAHWIAVDIGVGAFCSLGLGLFLYYVYWSKNEHIKWPLYLFYLAAAGAFLTKGIIGIFHIGVIIGVFILLRKRWDLLRRMLFSPALLMFLIPVGVWIYFFYCEGGIYFLHEHFINNTIGRFFHIKFEMSGSKLAFTDVGNHSPWFFYLGRLPEMFGGLIVFLPFIIWDGLRKLSLLPCKWVVYPENLKNGDRNKKRIVLETALGLLNGRKKEELDPKQKDIILFLLLWAFLPAFLLSFSSIKEVTYILPSYVAIALMISGWLDEKLNTAEKTTDALLWFTAITIPVVLVNVALAPLSPWIYIISVGVWLLLFLPFVVISAVKRRFVHAVFIVSAMVLCGIILGNTPEVMRRTRLNRKCYIDMTKHVFEVIGDKELHIFRGSETLRGSIPFYGKRHIPAIDSHETIKSILANGNGDFILVACNRLRQIQKDKELSRIIASCKVQTLPSVELDEDYVLISAPAVNTCLRKK